MRRPILQLFVTVAGIIGSISVSASADKPRSVVSTHGVVTLSICHVSPRH